MDQGTDSGSAVAPIASAPPVDEMYEEIKRLRQELESQKEENKRLKQDLEEKESEIQRLTHALFPTSRLPLEMLQRVISFMNVRDVTNNCMLVDKRWKQAARSDLKTRKHLSLKQQKNSSSSLWPGKQDEAFVFRYKKSVKAAAKILKEQMPGIKYLHNEWPEIREVDELILSLAPNLMSVRCGDNVIFPLKPGVVFASLTALYCNDVDNGTMAACPHLQSLEVTSDWGFTATDIPLTMQRLSVALSPTGQLTQQVEAITRLVNLTDISIVVRDCTIIPDHSIFLPLFRAFAKLISFKAHFLNGLSLTDGTADDAVEALVHRNPGLDEIELSGLPVTDQALVSFSRLQKLTQLDISFRGQKVTSQGVVSLFRGANARRLHAVIVKPTPHTGAQLSPASLIPAADRQVIESSPSEKARTFSYAQGFHMTTIFTPSSVRRV